MPSNPTVELWTLYALGVTFTVLRAYARVSAVGFRRLHPDDYLIWLAVVCLPSELSMYKTDILYRSSSTLRNAHSATSMGQWLTALQIME